MTFNESEIIIKYLADVQFVDYNDSWNISKFCAKLLRSKEGESQGREIVIRVRDAWSKIDENTKPIWNDLTEAAGLYPYVNSEFLSASAALRYEYHKSPHIQGIYLHEEQQTISLELQSGRSVVVSAPTSFGKSLLIEEVIASGIYKNIVIIQPTLALLDETRKKLLKYRSRYKLVVSTAQIPETTRGNIFLFTGERVVEYSNFPSIDFFVIDEFYKLSLDRDDDRAISLNQAFHKLLKATNKFYLLGPMIKNIPLSFKKKFDLTWFPTDFATVAVDEINLEITEKLKAVEKKRVKKETLFKLLSSDLEQTIIYCSSPNKATSLGLEYVTYLKVVSQGDLRPSNVSDNAEMIEWISENINSEWALNAALGMGVAFHHGALPRHLGSSVVDAFNKGAIRWLFCTSTLIEGVNTSAKNVVLYDKEKGNKKIDFFDYKNIAGRSGRMNEHFIGKVTRFEKQPEQMELFVDIPLFNQELAPLELLIGLESNDVEEGAKARLEGFDSLPEALKEVLRQNSAINIEGQLKIIEEIERNISGYHHLLSWSFPTYDQLLAAIQLAWNHLLKPGDNKADVRSPAQLTVLTNKYSNLKSIRAVILETINDTYWKTMFPDPEERINKVTFFILNITRHWFDYKLPKWLSVISNLQGYVFRKHNLSTGNYSFFAAGLEHGFLPPNLAALTEYDIPISAVNKLRRLINSELSPESTLSAASSLSTRQLQEIGLLKYEIRKLREAF